MSYKSSIRGNQNPRTLRREVVEILYKHKDDTVFRSEGSDRTSLSEVLPWICSYKALNVSDFKEITGINITKLLDEKMNDRIKNVILNALKNPEALKNLENFLSEHIDVSNTYNSLCDTIPRLDLPPGVKKKFEQISSEPHQERYIVCAFFYSMTGSFPYGYSLQPPPKTVPDSETVCRGSPEEPRQTHYRSEYDEKPQKEFLSVTIHIDGYEHETVKIYKSSS